MFPHRVLSTGERDWLLGPPSASSASTRPSRSPGRQATATPRRSSGARRRGRRGARRRRRDARARPLGPRRRRRRARRCRCRACVSRLHEAIVAAGFRHKVGLVADAGAWDVHHCALLVALGADAVVPLARLRHGRRARGDLPRRGARRLRRGDVDDRRDARLGLLRREARRGDRPRRGARRGASSPACPCTSAASAPSVLDREWLDFHHAAFRGRRAARRRRRVPVPEGGPPHFNSPEAVQALQAVSGYGRPRRRRASRRSTRPTAGSPSWSPGASRSCRSTCSASPRPARRRAARRGRARGGDPLALHRPGHERGRALRARAPHRRARHERALPLVPPALPARRPAAAARASAPSPTAARAASTRRGSAAPTATAASSTPGARFTITPMTAARAEEAEVKFAQGAKPGKGGQLPGRQGLAAHRAPARLRARASSWCRRRSTTTSTRSRTSS